MSFFSELSRRNVFRVAIAYSVVAWLVAQVAELALDSFGTPDWGMKTILLVLVLGLPIAILFAWAFEMTPEGIKLEKDVDRTQSITRQTGRKLNYTIIGILVVALVLSIATRDWSADTEDATPDQTVTSSDKSIAVLPFINMSDDKENEYFSDGISEELLNVLVKVEGLRVASRTSSFSFKGKDTPIPEIANALKVEHVLEGSVRKAGDTIRITAQLIDVKTDSHLWSETYDRKFEDIFVIQDEISAHIVEALRVALGAGGEIAENVSKPTESLAAYDDYLRARHFWQRRGGENIRKAIQLFEKATKADPDFARAWSGLAAAHLTMPTYSGEPAEDHFPAALGYANKALDLDPAIAEAHAVIGDLLRFDRRWAEAEEHYLKAIELEPKNSTGYLWYAEQLTATGRKEAALTNSVRALDLDPFNPGTNSMAAAAYAMNGDFDKSVTHSEATWELGHPAGLFQLIQSYVLSGDIEQARRLVDQNVQEIGSEESEELRDFLSALEDPDKVDDFLDWILNLEPTPTVWMALDHFRLGRADRGMELALQANIDGGEWMAFWAPDVYAIGQHPRFGELVRANGLDKFWDGYGWPSQCSRDGETITCR